MRKSNIANLELKSNPTYLNFKEKNKYTIKKTPMKRILAIVFIVMIASCKDDKPLTNDNVSLQEQKKQIEQQIDSLHEILNRINEQLTVEQTKEAPKIEAFVVQPEYFAHYIELQGNIDTDGNVMVIPEVMGKVKKIYKNEGGKVRKGETLILLDDAVIRNQISEVQTQYELAKTAYERQKRLWDQKIGSEMAYLQAKTKKESLARKLTTLNSQLAKFKIKAPISGVLDDLMIKEGEMAAPQHPVARLVNLSKVYMQADVSERYLPQIKKGTQVIIDFPELNKSIQSQVSYVGNFIHPNNRTFKIRVNLFNPDGELKPNLTGNIKIKDFEKQDAVVLPLSLVQEDKQGNNYVFVLLPVENETDVYQVKKQEIVLGPAYKGLVLIKSGLQYGDIIAGEAARGLTAGDRVKIANEEEINQSGNNQKTGDSETKQVEYHKVKKGETLFRIHKKYHVSLDSLRKWNRLKTNRLKAGQKLVVSK